MVLILLLRRFGRENQRYLYSIIIGVIKKTEVLIFFPIGYIGFDKESRGIYFVSKKYSGEQKNGNLNLNHFSLSYRQLFQLKIDY